MKNLKVLGLTFVAALAMSAIAASSAFATEEGHIVGAEGGTHVTTNVTGSDYVNLVFQAGESTVTCEEDEFHAVIPGGTTKTLTVTPTFGGGGTGELDGKCTAGNLPATVHENGCHLHFKTAQTAEPPDTHTWKVTSAVTCPQGVPGIQVTVFFNSNHSALNRVCTVTVPQAGNENLTGVIIHNNTPLVGNDDLTVTVDVPAITRTQQGLCGHQHGTATFKGSVTMQGVNEDEEPVDVYIAHTQP